MKNLYILIFTIVCLFSGLKSNNELFNLKKKFINHKWQLLGLGYIYYVGHRHSNENKPDSNPDVAEMFKISARSLASALLLTEITNHLLKIKDKNQKVKTAAVMHFMHMLFRYYKSESYTENEKVYISEYYGYFASTRAHLVASLYYIAKNQLLKS
jgi:hypothetical protein